MSESNDVVSARIVAISTLIEKLSSSNLTKLIVAGFFGILLYTLFEQRTIFISTLMTSPTLAFVFGALILMLLIAFALNHIFNLQQDRINNLQHQVDEDHKHILEILRKTEE